MHPHTQLIEKFYTSFSRCDWKGMVDCYHEDIFFYDPVFENLNAAKTAGMWEMLCKNARDLVIRFDNVKADDEYGSCNWVAEYTFSQTGRKVSNKVRAHFQFHEGKIVEHMDDFDLWSWSRQALGMKGLLLGWTPFVQNRIRKNAQRNLERFLQQKQPQEGVINS